MTYYNHRIVVIGGIHMIRTLHNNNVPIDDIPIRTCYNVICSLYEDIVAPELRSVKPPAKKIL